MGDICNHIEILIILNLCRPLVVSTHNYTLTFNTDGNEYPVPRVVNGQKAELGQFPYQIALKQSMGMNMYMTFCGGALIGPRKILTAAHCFAVEANWCEKKCTGKANVVRLNSKLAVAGTLKNKEAKYRNDEQQWRTMTSVLIPVGYKFPSKDIAVTFTKKPFEMNKYVNTIPIARKRMDYGSKKCIVSGYGRLSERVNSPLLMWAELDVLNVEQCNYEHGENMDLFICTSSSNADVLQGDSGGPLVCFNTKDPNDNGQGVVVGVVSGTKKPGGTFFTRVTSYRDFLEKNNASIPTINVSCLCILILYYIKFFL